MIQTKIKDRINFPKITLTRDLEKVAKNIIIPDMIRGIDDAMAIKGGELPKNEPATIKRKGHSRQLIDTGKLRRSFFYRRRSAKSVFISVKGDRKEVGKALVGGIRTRRGLKKYLFFGISKDAHNKAMAYMRKRIAEILKRGRNI